MAHVLDNPVWNALISSNSGLCEGSELVKFFASNILPFVGFAANTPQAFSRLQTIIPRDRVVGVIPLTIPPQWQLERAMLVWQMVLERPPAGVLTELPLIPLGPEHVPAMLALTQQTNLGPFFPNTIAFGHYQGIFEGEKLVAMAGQRLHPTPYAEISAVCTHPDYLGRGFAAQLIQRQARRIFAERGIPFLHVKSDNTRAISLYQHLGFVPRKEMSFYIIRRTEPSESSPWRLIH